MGRATGLQGEISWADWARAELRAQGYRGPALADVVRCFGEELRGVEPVDEREARASLSLAVLARIAEVKRAGG